MSKINNITESDRKAIKNKNNKGNKNKSGFCPNCGAYVGGFATCPWCKNTMPHAKRLHFTQAVAVLITIFGLIGLTFYAQIDPAPKITIGEIGPTYSNGQVTIVGNITNIDFREASDGSWRMLVFTVTDDTGSIDVKAYTEITDELIASHNTPALGDICEVRGSIYIRGDDTHILLDAAQYLHLIRTLDYVMTADDLSAAFKVNSSEYINKRVQINGTVTQIDSDGAYFDINETIRVYFPEYLKTFSPDATLTLIVGDFVQVSGLVQDYYGICEIVPATLDDIVLLSHGGIVND